MMGTGTFAEPTFRALLGQARHPVVALVTNPDRPAGRDRVMTRGMKDIALAHQVPVLQPESIKAPDAVAAIREHRPDLFVVAAYGQILPKELLEVPPLGGINVHSSLLPRYRGSAPIVWAIYNGDTETGVTIIRMSPRMDAGDILAQARTPIGPQETAGDLEARLAEMGAALALETVNRLAAGPVPGTPQDPAQVTRAPKLTKEHGRIEWTRTADQVGWQVRAMQPWPTAYTAWRRPDQPPMRLLLLQAAPLPQTTDQPPGTVALVTPDTLGIAAGQGTVVGLVRLQPAGKRPMTAAEFLRGHRVQKGQRFGPEPE
jgi:methionyl-tRNA formyltransferase